MIKIIKNIFTSKEECHKSSVDVVVDIPTASMEDMFDDAVKKVIHDKISESVKDELIKMCYDDEEIRQTDLARERLYRVIVTKKNSEEIMKDLPKAVITNNGHFNSFRLEFDFSKFVEKIVSEALNDK